MGRSALAGVGSCLQKGPALSDIHQFVRIAQIKSLNSNCVLVLMFHAWNACKECYFHKGESKRPEEGRWIQKEPYWLFLSASVIIMEVGGRWGLLWTSLMHQQASMNWPQGGRYASMHGVHRCFNNIDFAQTFLTICCWNSVRWSRGRAEKEPRIPIPVPAVLVSELLAGKNRKICKSLNWF